MKNIRHSYKYEHQRAVSNMKNIRHSYKYEHQRAVSNMKNITPIDTNMKRYTNMILIMIRVIYQI